MSIQIGDVIAFRCDVDQIGVITAIDDGDDWTPRTYAVRPPSGGGFYGEFIGGKDIAIIHDLMLVGVEAPRTPVDIGQRRTDDALDRRDERARSYSPSPRQYD